MTTDEHDKLDPFCGLWIGQGLIHPNPWGGTGPTEATWWFRCDDADKHLLCDCRETRSDGSTFAAHAVLGSDQTNGELIWWWFDSYGYPPIDPARGSWDGSTLMLIKTSPRGMGRTAFSIDAGKLECRIDTRPAGEAQFTLVMAGSFAKACS